MTWDGYDAPPEIVLYGQTEAASIAEEKVNAFIAENATKAGKALNYQSVIDALRAIAVSAATRGFKAGYNRAVDEYTQGLKLTKLAVTPKPADHR